jgi:hypothetical protein
MRNWDAIQTSSYEMWLETTHSFPRTKIYKSESVTLQLPVYRQSVRLGDKSFETHDQ